MSDKVIKKWVLLLNIGFVSTTGIIAALTVLNPGPLRAATETLKGRTPASLPAISTVAKDIQAKNLITTIQLTCSKGHKQTLTVPAETLQVRLTGKHCNPNSDFKFTKIINKSSNYQATVFKLSNNSFTSDLIQLSQEKNTFFIEELDKKGLKQVLKLTILVE